MLNGRLFIIIFLLFMSNTNQRISYLLEVWTQRTATPAEESELFSLISENSGQAETEAHMHTLLSGVGNSASDGDVDWDGLYERILKGRDQEKADKPVRPLRWLRQMTAAAAVLILICVASWLFYNRDDRSSYSAQNLHDIKAPTTGKAILSTEGGCQVVLDNVQDGALAGVSGAYKTGATSLRFESDPKKIEMRTLTNPRGSKAISMELPDGTLVWLNAASSISFPSAFNGNERLVTLTGEAYFEAKHDLLKPFRVKVNKEVIEDIGTKFNINAYDDENALTTTLVEGAVKVRNKILVPGEQASIDKAGALSIDKQVDVADVIAWKDGRFRYHSVDIQTVLRQASRWYNVDVQYRGRLDETFSGGIGRDVNLSELLKMLEKMKVAHFAIEGNEIIVTPMNN